MSAGNDSLEHSRELQEKFELYLLALLFTLLAAAVQTAKFDGGSIANALELLGWLLLLLSGLVGLWRLELAYVAHMAHGKKLNAVARWDAYDEAAQRTDTLQVKRSDEVLSIRSEMDKLDSTITKLTEQEQAFDISLRRRWGFHKWTFVFGLSLLLGSRGLAPAVALAVSLRGPSTAQAAASSPSPAASRPTSPASQRP